MLDCKTEIVSNLSTVLSTYYELFCDSSTATPCITYREHSNSLEATGDTLGYSTVGWYIKLWTTSVEDLATYAPLIDTKMRSLGYKRQSSNELVQGNQICKIMIYQGLGKETFN